MDPNDLRSIVEHEIASRIEPEAWKRCELVNRAERESLAEVMSAWGINVGGMAAPAVRPRP